MKYTDPPEEKNSVKRLDIGELAVFILFYHLTIRPFISTFVTASPLPPPPIPIYCSKYCICEVKEEKQNPSL
jgi:hypothetical protein